MSESRNSPPRPTRRRFLLGSAAVATEAAFGPVGKIGEYLTSLTILPEGNPAQRLGRFEKLAHLVAKDPSPENQNLSFAWIKFNLAEVYGFSDGFPLSSSLMRHFLYGRGETQDISDGYKKAVIADSRILSSREKDEEAILASFFQNSLDSNAMMNKYLHAINPEDLKAIQEGEMPKVLTLRTLFNATIRDFRYSLNHHTVDTTGQVTRVIPKDSGFDITLANPSFTIYDRYDWNGGTDFSASSNVAQMALVFLGKLGIEDPRKELDALIGKENSDKLSGQKLSVTDKEAALLIQKGFGNEFDIRAKVAISKPVTVHLPDPRKLSPKRVPAG